MAIYLIRHGQTDFNAEFRFQGSTDVPLNATGRDQARRLKRLLERKGVRLWRLISSPLSRAVETASIISGDPPDVIIEPQLAEIDLGQYEGRLESEIAEMLGPDAYAAWRAKCYTVPAPDGESMDDAIARVRMVTERICELGAENDVGVVAHQGVFMAVKSVISGRRALEDLQGYRQANDEVDVWCGRRRLRLDAVRAEVAA